MSTQNHKKTTLAQLRKRSGHVKQSVVALCMNVQEPAVSKLEQKTIERISLDKLSAYLAAIGATVDVKIVLSDGSVISVA